MAAVIKSTQLLISKEINLKLRVFFGQWCAHLKRALKAPPCQCAGGERQPRTMKGGRPCVFATWKFPGYLTS